MYAVKVSEFFDGGDMYLWMLRKVLVNPGGAGFWGADTDEIWFHKPNCDNKYMKTNKPGAHLALQVQVSFYSPVN